MANFTIYHNPRCSKSRQTLALLKENGVVPDVVEYLKEVPGVNELEAICAKLGKAPLEWTRTGESVFKALGLSKKDKRSHGDWLQILAGNPILIERPIVVSGGKAVLGRPPENVLELF
jgi:arsenate reductase